MNKHSFVCIILLSISNVNSYPIGPSECDLCQIFVKGGKNFLSYNHTIVELQDYLDVTCDFFGPYRNTCKEFLNTVTPNIISLINNNHTAVEVCSKTSSCINYDDINALFADIIQSVEAYVPNAYAYAEVDDDVSDDNNLIYTKVNITKPEVVSRPIIFEFIDFGDVADF